MRRALLLGLVSTTVALSPVHAESGRQVYIHSDTPHESYMWTLTKNTFWGAAFGLLTGGAVLLISGFEADPAVVAYTSGAGAFVGAGVGVWEIVDRRAQVAGPVALTPTRGGARVSFQLAF